MKIKMDINRWRTSADVSVLECEPMYAGSMYVHKLFVESNLYENEVLQAEFRVGGKKVAQASLLYKEAVDGQFALYEALIPSKLFKTHAPKQVDVVIGLFKSNDGVLSSILITQAQSFTIEGEGHMFENGMDEDERELFNENLVHLTGKINEFNDIVKNNEDNISNIKEKVSNFKVGEIIAKSSESGAEPKVEAEIVDSETPNEFKLNMNFTLPRGEQGDAAGFDTPTATAVSIASSFQPRVEVTASGPDTAKKFNFDFEIPCGKVGDNGLDGASFLTLKQDYDESTTKIPIGQINIPWYKGGSVYGNDTLISPNGNLFRVTAGNEITGASDVSVEYYANIKGNLGPIPNLSVTATVDDTVGTPSVTVTESGTPEAPEINLAFHNLKGETGEVVGAVTGVKGEAETEYRQGNVNITPANIGLENAKNIFYGVVDSKDSTNGVIIWVDTDSFTKIKKGDVIIVEFTRGFKGTLNNVMLATQKIVPAEKKEINIYFSSTVGSDYLMENTMLNMPNETILAFYCSEIGGTTLVAITQPTFTSSPQLIFEYSVQGTTGKRVLNYPVTPSSVSYYVFQINYHGVRYIKMIPASIYAASTAENPISCFFQPYDTADAPMGILLYYVSDAVFEISFLSAPSSSKLSIYYII